MALASHVLASGSGWRVADVVCTLRPARSPFRGAARRCLHRGGNGRDVPIPLDARVGRAGAGRVAARQRSPCFECGHEHGVGDRCLSFQFAPEFLRRCRSRSPGRAPSLAFSVPRLPPHPALLPIIAAAEAAREDGDTAAFEEVGAASCRRGFRGVGRNEGTARRAPSRRDERRITAALRRIEAQADEPLSLPISRARRR